MRPQVERVRLGDYRMLDEELLDEIEAGKIDRGAIRNESKASKISFRKRKWSRNKANRKAQAKVARHERKRTYSEYLESPEWRKTREAHFARAGYHCVICGTKHRITVHHVYYRGRGKEAPEDLVSVCYPHHDQFHREFGRGNKDYRVAWQIFEAREAAKFKFQGQ